MQKQSERADERTQLEQEKTETESSAASDALSQREYIFERAPVRTAVLRQVAPAVASQMVALVYSMADTFFVGLLNLPAQTAAVHVANPSFMFLTALSNLFGVGGAAVISRLLGQKRREQAGRVAAFCFWGGAGVSLLFSLLFFLFRRPILTVCGGSAETLPTAMSYGFYVIVLGSTPTVLATVLGNLTRAEGRAAAASLGVMSGSILNIVLDPIFVLPRFLNMGAAGAGLATALSNCFSLLLFLVLIRKSKGETVLDLSPAALRSAGENAPEVLRLGFPSAVQYALTVVAIASQSHFVSAYGSTATAALAIIKKIDNLPLYFSIGVSNGLLPLVAYNHGAKNEARSQKIFRFGLLLSFGLALFCTSCFELFAPRLTGCFIRDLATVQLAAGFLRRMCTAMPFMSLCYPLIIRFQATGRAKEALIVSILRKGVLDIPLLFLYDALLPLYGCMWVQPTVDCVSLVTALFLGKKKKPA